jgi:hypothetical protein
MSALSNGIRASSITRTKHGRPSKTFPVPGLAPSRDVSRPRAPVLSRCSSSCGLGQHPFAPSALPNFRASPRIWVRLICVDPTQSNFDHDEIHSMIATQKSAQTRSRKSFSGPLRWTARVDVASLLHLHNVGQACSLRYDSPVSGRCFLT